MQQHKLIKIKTVKFWKDKNTLFLVNEHGQMQIVGANLVKHVLEIPYVKKDGTHVSKEQIVKMKEAPNKNDSNQNSAYGATKPTVTKPTFVKPRY